MVAAAEGQAAGTTALQPPPPRPGSSLLQPSHVSTLPVPVPITVASPRPSPTNMNSNINVNVNSGGIGVGNSIPMPMMRPPASNSAARAIQPSADGKPRLERVEFLITSTPVEGCEIVPYVVIRTAAGEAKSAETIEAKTRGALSVQYRWNRCAATYTCARKCCLRPATVQFVPLLKIAHSRDIKQDQYDAIIKQSFFCSQRCLQNNWLILKQLQEKYAENYPRRDVPLSGLSGIAGISAKIGASSISSASSTSKSPAALDDEVERARLECVPGRSDGMYANPLPNPTKKTEVAWIRNYAPTCDDVGTQLELVCRYVYRVSKDANADIGPPMSIRSKFVKSLPDPPPERSMFNLLSRERYNTSSSSSDPSGNGNSNGNRNGFGNRNGNGNGNSGNSSNRRAPGTFRVLTYNVLAEIYTTVATYPNCPAWALAWTYRKRNLIREISKYEADILCLQEVQADHYEDHFNPYFTRLGYQGCFKVKTRESMGRKGKIDGCATLFRKDQFILRSEHLTEYNTVAQQRTKNSRALNRCLKGNVALILVLDAVDGSGPIVVANTHLFWDPDLTDVKLFQADVFLNELELVLQKHHLDARSVPIIIGGDFNSEPNSSVYELISNGICTLSRADVPNDSYGVLGTCNLRHSMHLRSAYSAIGNEPNFTNYTSNFVGVLDYLWYSPETLAATAILEIPDEDVLLQADWEPDSITGQEPKTHGERKGIPNTQWSSDHIALMTEFQVVKPNRGLSHGRI